MLNLRSRTGVILLLATGQLSGCFHSSDDGGGDDNSTGNGNATVAAAAVAQVLGITDFADSGPADPIDDKVPMKSRARNLSKRLAAVNDKLKTLRLRTVVAAAVTTNCSGGGTKTIDSSTSGITSIFDNCVEEYNGVTSYRNGVFSFSDNGSSLVVIAGDGINPYIGRETRTSDGRLEFESRLLFQASAFVGTTTLTCNSMAIPSSYRVTMSGTTSVKEDWELDGVLDTDDSTTATDFKIDVTVVTMNTTECEPAMVSLTESGAISYTDNANAKNSVSLEIAASNPVIVTVEWTEKDGIWGEQYTVNGTLTVTSPCFNGTLTLATPTPIWVPDYYFMGWTCPTAGVIAVTGDATATITYTSTGGVNIDAGSDGSSDSSYASCDDINTCA